MAPSWISTSNVLPGDAEAEEVLGEQQMSGRGDGKELGQSLDEAKEDDLPDRHRRPRRLCARSFLCGGED